MKYISKINISNFNFFSTMFFTETLKQSRGRYTDVQAARMSQMGGSMGNVLKKLYEVKVAETYVSTNKGGKANYKSDVTKFVNEYKGDKLFDVQAGRQHSAFPGYHFNTTLKNPRGRLIERLNKYAKKLDKTRDVLPQ